MKLKRFAILLFFGALSLAHAQKTQTQVTKAVSPEEDGKANSAAVPEVMTVSSQFERVVLVRLKFKTDLLKGLEQAIAKEGIQNGVILSGFGSTRSYHVHGVSNRDFPSENFYMKDPTHPSDIVNVSGMILNGRLHPHLTLADDQIAFGGHLEAGTEVFTFANVTIGVLPDDLEIGHFDNKHIR